LFIDGQKLSQIALIGVIQQQQKTGEIQLPFKKRQLNYMGKKE
jgi:hypothetical protein